MPDDPMNDYLLALGRITQSYRNLDAKIFGVSTKIFGFNELKAIVLLGGNDPKRILDKITRYLEEVMRSRSFEMISEWRTLISDADQLITKRNIIVHSIEAWDYWPEKISYVRLGTSVLISTMRANTAITEA